MTKAKRRPRRKVDLYTRLSIAKYLNDGMSIASLARTLDRDYTVIYKEIKQYTFDGLYDPVLAQEMASVSQKLTEEEKANRRKLDDKIKIYIEEKLSKKWSPRQIASQIEKDIGVYVSYPTIYRYIRRGLVKVDIKKDMRHGGKKYNKSTEKRGKIKVGDRAIMYRPAFNKET